MSYVSGSDGDGRRGDGVGRRGDGVGSLGHGRRGDGVGSLGDGVGSLGDDRLLVRRVLRQLFCLLQQVHHLHHVRVFISCLHLR